MDTAEVNVLEKKERVYDRATWPQLIGAAFAGIATNSNFFFFLGYFMIYSTDNLLLNAGIIGTLMTLARFIDGAIDPAIGLMIDKTNTRFGRFRPWALGGSIIMNLSIIILFWGVNFTNQFMTYAWVMFWYIIWVVGYSFTTTATQSGMNILTNDPNQRTLATTLGTILFIPLQLLVFSYGSQLLVNFGGVQDPAAFRKFIGIIVAISLTATLIWIAAISSKDTKENLEKKNAGSSTNQKYSFKDFISLLRGNKPLQYLIGAAASEKLAGSIRSSSMAYFFLIVVGSAAAQATVTAPGAIIGIAGSFLALAISVRVGKRNSFISGATIGLIAMLATIIFRPFGEDSIWLFTLLYGMITIASNITQVSIYSMIPDIVDYENWQSGRYLPGMVQTTFTFIDQMVSSLSGLIIGLVLGIFSYQAGMDVTPGIYWGIVFLFLGVGAIAEVVAIFFMRKYEITPKVFEQLTDDLNDRADALTEEKVEGAV